MTREEAAELILKNDPWVKCPRSQDEDHPQDCECELSGALLRPEYKEAYRVLGRPQPPIWKRTEMANGGYRISGPSVFVGKFPLMKRLVPIGGLPHSMEKLMDPPESGSSKETPETPRKD